MRGKARFVTLALVAVLGLALPALAFEPGHAPASMEALTHVEAVLGSPIPAPDYVLMARDTLELEDRSGYSGEYVFGMTKGIMRSTLTPALKPVVLLLTVPLDIAFLPFAAIAGFF